MSTIARASGDDWDGLWADYGDSSQVNPARGTAAACSCAGCESGHEPRSDIGSAKDLALMRAKSSLG